MRRKSARFESGNWLKRLAPLILATLLLALLAVLILVALSVAGLTPGS